MKAITKSLLLLALLVVAAACYKQVARESTPPETVERMAGWPKDVKGVVLRDGRTIELPAGTPTQVEGDSLILKQIQGEGRVFVDTIRIADVTHVMVSKPNALGIAATVLVVGAVVAMVVAATEEPPEPDTTYSCPFIYAYDGSAYRPNAEPLGGAITGGLQRTDLSRLEDLVDDGGVYRVIIGNEMPEVQHLDAFGLVAADHPQGTSVIADRAGNLHVVAPTVAPLRATGTRGEDLLPVLRAEDEQWWPTAVSSARFPSPQRRDTLTLVFPRPRQPDARLVLHARTSALGAHTLKTMLDLWGGEVDYWYALLDDSPPVRSAHEEWVAREELWVVKLWVLERDGWAAQEVVVGGGPIISELQVVALDLSRVAGPTVELRLHPAHAFWDIDFAALDTAAMAPPFTTEIAIAEAESLSGQDSRALLSAPDGDYLLMARTGERIDVSFAAPPRRPGMARTVFSRATGFYRIETDRSGSRSAATLDSLWLQPGFAIQLAEREFMEEQSRHAARHAGSETGRR